MTRIFIDSTLCIGGDVALPRDAARHLAQVLRAREGAHVTVFNGTGGEYSGVIKTLTRHDVVVQLTDFNPAERESALQITLVQSISRGERMDYTIQKAVELGATSIAPVTSHRTQVTLSGDRALRRLAHWRGIIQNACEQCGRNRVPHLHPIVGLEELIATASFDTGIVLAPAGQDNIAELDPKSASFGLVIGPEGGLDPGELAQCHAAGFKALRLGPRVLRTETAAVVGLSILQQRFGDL